jgi:hypothetical protein
MAEPLDQPGAVQLLEDAAHLLRGASLETLLCHWIGSVPFALALLVCWNSLTHPPVTESLCAAESMSLALLLIWMNCWRSAYAGRLYRALSGSAEKPWSPRRVRRLVANQALLAASKLLMLPVSFVACVPFATTVTFYRYAAVLADSDSTDPLAVIARARRLGRGEQAQSWLLQALLLLLSMGAMLNIAAAFILLPSLVKALTGYESAFSRSGSSFFTNVLFVLLVLAATWLIFDPFVQAVYCLRCFHAESRETGGDLRADLRRIRAARAGIGAVAILVSMLVAAPRTASAAGAVSPRELDQAVQDTMQAAEYNWRTPPPLEAASGSSWIIAATDRAINALQSAVHWAESVVERFLRWVFGGLGLSPMPQAGMAPSAGLHWSVWLLTGIAAILAGWVVWRAIRSRRRRPAPVPRPANSPIRLEDENIVANRLSETEWLEMAESCLREGNARLALRGFYLANLAWLGREEFLTIHAGKTNSDFETELRRKARHSPEGNDLFRRNVLAFECAWYGLYEVFEPDAREIQRRSEEMKMRLKAGAAV